MELIHPYMTMWYIYYDHPQPWSISCGVIDDINVDSKRIQIRATIEEPGIIEVFDADGKLVLEQFSNKKGKVTFGLSYV